MTDADPREEIDTLRSRLRSDGDDARYVQFDADRDHLLRMSDNIRKVPKQIGEFRHLKLLRHTSRMAALAPPPTVADFEENDEAADAGVETEADVEELLDEHGLLGLTLKYRAAAEALTSWIHDEYSNEHTNQDYRTALRSFGRYRQKRDDPPPSLDWISTDTSNNFDPVPSERDLLKYDADVVPMIDACHNARDEALIALQFEAGLRGGELYDLRVGDVFDAEHTTGVHVDGKTGERTVHLRLSVGSLYDWLDRHPAGDVSDAYLWSKLNTSERPSYNTFLNYFKNAAERAGVSKAVTPTNFRKSNARWLILRGFAQKRIEQRQGRKPGSDHTARYIAEFNEESNELAYLETFDVDVGSKEPASSEVEEIECDRCGRLNPGHRDYCNRCRFALSDAAAAEVEAARPPEFDVTWEDHPGDENYLNWYLNTLVSGNLNERVKVAEMYLRQLPAECEVEKVSAPTVENVRE